jgi:[NiFe] hydrogenase diaphorase moiety large subunit
MIETKTNELTFSKIEKNVGLKSALKADIIGIISDSKLKGRGGAGFPTGFKWKLAADAEGDTKYVVCNADEGEPGTFKDRLILTDFADLVFEGMTIGGLAIKAKLGIMYLRAEYTYLLEHLEKVLAKRRVDNLLGANILGKKGFDFDIEIRMGAGAYVCGEETALIESLEGQRGEPRNRPPYPVDTGLNHNPSIVNNIETYCWAACILVKGADWFKSAGTEKSTGYKLLSISGDVPNPGVYEIPYGISIRDVVMLAGGKCERTTPCTGIKAAAVGGASGICVPAKDFGRKIAFEDVSTGGSVIVFGSERDMLKVAENFLEFFVEESCGQCTPCREGNPVLLKGVKELRNGKSSTAHLKDLCSLGETMQLASKCGLGQSSPNAFLSIVEHFKDEIMGRTPMNAGEGE